MTKRALHAPYPTDPGHWRLEVDAAAQVPTQLPLLGSDEPTSRFGALLGVLPELAPTSSPI